MRKLFDFLRELQKNNSKTWMDAHRNEYEEIRDYFRDWVEELNARLLRLDKDYEDTPPKKAVHRINNNLMYHPDKPTYKDNFSASLDQGKKKSEFYIHLGLSGSFIAGGFYKPPSEILNSLREAIDYEGDKLVEIIENPDFKKTFGELVEEDKLKTAPKGFSADHPHIELLRLKSLAVSQDITQKEAIAGNFADKVIELYQLMQPFREFLHRAVSV